MIMSASKSELIGITRVIQRLDSSWSTGNHDYARFNHEHVRTALWNRVWEIKCQRTRESLRYAIDGLAKMEERILLNNIRK